MTRLVSIFLVLVLSTSLGCASERYAQHAKKANQYADLIDNKIRLLVDNGKVRTQWSSLREPAEICFGLAWDSTGEFDVILRNFAPFDQGDGRQKRIIDQWRATADRSANLAAAFCGERRIDGLDIPVAAPSQVLHRALVSLQRDWRAIASTLESQDWAPAPGQGTKTDPRSVGVMEAMRGALDGILRKGGPGTPLNAKQVTGIAYLLGIAAGNGIAGGVLVNQAVVDWTPAGTGPTACSTEFVLLGEKLFLSGAAYAGTASAEYQIVPPFVMSDPLLERIVDAQSRLTAQTGLCADPRSRRPYELLGDLIAGVEMVVTDRMLKIVAPDGVPLDRWRSEADAVRFCEVLGDSPFLEIGDTVIRMKNRDDPVQEAAYELFRDTHLRLRRVGGSLCYDTFEKPLVPFGRLSPELLAEIKRVKSSLLLAAAKFRSPNNVPNRNIENKSKPKDLARKLAEFSSQISAMSKRLIDIKTGKADFSTRLATAFSQTTLRANIHQYPVWYDLPAECGNRLARASDGFMYHKVSDLSSQSVAQVADAYARAIADVDAVKDRCD